MNNKKNIIKGLSVIALYLILSYCNLPLLLLNINYSSLSLTAKEIYNIGTEIALIIIIYIIFKEQFHKAWVDIKKNHMKYFTKYFKYYLLGLIFMVGANMIINIVGGGLSGNESAVRNQFSIAPIYTFITSVFLAPVLEESIFRLGFRNIFKNNILFILISGLVFGGMHLLNGISSIELLPLYLVSYSSIGIAFAYILTKTNNIFITIALHAMHNGLLMSLQVLLLIFG